MVLAILVFSVISTALSFLALASLGRLWAVVRDFREEHLGAVQLGIHNYQVIESKIDNSMACLVSSDAALHILKTNVDAAVEILEETRVNAP